MIRRLEAITFDDFLTLRYSTGEEEDIIFPILRSLKQQNLDIDDEGFLDQYFELDSQYRERLKQTLRESTLDEVVLSTLVACGHNREGMSGIVRNAVECGLETRRTKWFSDAKPTLATLRERGFKLGVISNTHWGWLPKVRREFERSVDVVILSCEHGFAKPHPSIFTTTLNQLEVRPDHALHVGDDYIADIEGARGVGMRTAFVRRAERRVNADFEIRQLRELTRLISCRMKH